jgi:ketosteroid isomerase-like protein
MSNQMSQERDREAAVKIVESWNAAWMARDLEGMKAIAHDDFIQWHATIRKNLSKDEEFAMLTAALEVMNIKFHHIRLTPLDGGVLQQCLADIQIDGSGEANDVPFAMIFRLKDGRIVRCDEYMDGMSLPKIPFAPTT